MTKTDAIRRLTAYLKSLGIYFENDFDTDGTPRVTMAFKNCPNCPSKVLESCVYFYKDCLEVKNYYNKNAANWCREYQENLPSVIRLLNYINATVWMGSLYTPRIFLTEDNRFDITLTTIINLDFYELAPVETEEYITAFCPDLLNKLSPAIFLLLLGSINLEQAKIYIRDL